MLSLRIRRKLPLVLCCLIVIFLIMKRGKQQRHFEMFIPDQEPKAVWDVLADFSNMPHLNTRIQRWQLVEESGNFDRWTYRVVTYETMVGGFLLGLNENHGEVVVEPVSPPDHYHLQEVYTTYSLHGWLVVKNYGKMNFLRSNRGGHWGTLLKQEAFSDCPLLFHFLCVLEIDLNRQDFQHNLAKWFAK
ncbi:uncharacterized protein [Panulirus ornatus]|uniref:uncharacterized protein isoform X3 n=1 Tax=Panulirus ornatus TaxID=150431 RepID=UPI003A845856